MLLYLNYTHQDEVRVVPLRKQLSKTGYVFTNEITECNYFIAFLSASYLNDIDAQLKLTYAACSSRSELVLVSLDELTVSGLPAEIEMLAAKHGLIAPEEICSNLMQRKTAPWIKKDPNDNTVQEQTNIFSDVMSSNKEEESFEMPPFLKEALLKTMLHLEEKKHANPSNDIFTLFNN